MLRDIVSHRCAQEVGDRQVCLLIAARLLLHINKLEDRFLMCFCTKLFLKPQKLLCVIKNDFRIVTCSYLEGMASYKCISRVVQLVVYRIVLLLPCVHQVQIFATRDVFKSEK